MEMWEVALAMIMKEEGSKYWERFIVEVGSCTDVFFSSCNNRN